MYKEWVLDVTNGVNPPCFIPYKLKTDTLILGMNLISDKCPGKLVGIVHLDGQKKANNWTENNPDWYEKYSK